MQQDICFAQKFVFLVKPAEKISHHEKKIERGTTTMCKVLCNLFCVTGFKHLKQFPVYRWEQTLIIFFQ